MAVFDPTMKNNPKYWSQRRRHLALNEILDFSENHPVFQYIMKAETPEVMEYVKEFRMQVRGKHEFNPALMLELLKKVGKAMERDFEEYVKKQKEEQENNE